MQLTCNSASHRGQRAGATRGELQVVSSLKESVPPVANRKGISKLWTRTISRSAGQSWFGACWSAAVGFIIGTLVLMRNGGGLLYGEDSSIISGAFSFNHSPVIPYSYLYSQTFPVPDNAPYFFQDLVVWLLDRLIGDPALLQRLFMLGWFGLAAIGIWLVTGTLNSAWYGTRKSNTIPRTCAVLAYLANPFSLSVIWWHIEGWTQFYVFLPFLFWVILEIYISESVQFQKVALVCFLGLILAPGLTGTFSVPIAGIVIIFLAADLVRAHFEHIEWRTRMWRTLELLVIPLLLFGWDFIPYLLLPSQAYTSSGYVTAQNIVAQFYRSSTTTGFLNDLRMVGFSWLLSVPGAYPWGRGLWLLLIGGTLLALLFGFGAMWVRTRRGLGLLYIIALLAVFASAGANGIATPVNRWALGLGGPFLILANSYYFVLEAYVLVVCIAVFLFLVELPQLIEHSVRWVRRKFERLLAFRPGSKREGWGTALIHPAVPRRRKSTRTSRVVAGATVVLVLVAPVVLYGIYQPAGANIDTFDLPTDFSDLQTYLTSNYSGPDLNVLVLPMSSLNALPTTIGNESFIDSSYLFSNFIPYPVLCANVGPLSAALMDWFAQSNLTGLLTILRALHVGFVVVDPYANQSSYFVSTAPDNSPVNWSHVESQLLQQLGPPANVGAFRVFTVSDVVPMAWATTSLGTVSTSGLVQFLQFLGAVRATGPLSNWLGTAVWAGGIAAGNETLVPLKVTGPEESLALLNNSTPMAVLLNGSTVGVSDSGAPWLSLQLHKSGPIRLLSLLVPTQANLTNSSNVVTDMDRTESGYHSMGGTSAELRYRDPVSGPGILQSNFSIAPGAPQNWVTYFLTAGALTIRIQFYTNSTANFSSLGISAEVNGLPFAWNDLNLPWGAAPSSLSLTAWVNQSSIFAGVTDLRTGAIVNETLFTTGTSALERNPGYNGSVAMGGLPTPQSLNLSIESVGPNLNLGAMSYFAQPRVAYLISAPASLNASLIGSSPDVSSTGSWSLSFAVPLGSDVAIVLALPGFGAWAASSNAGTLTRAGLNPVSNVFVFHPTVQPGTFAIVTLNFRNLIDTGLVVGIAEFFATAAVLVAAVVSRVGFRNRPKQGDPQALRIPRPGSESAGVGAVSAEH